MENDCADVPLAVDSERNETAIRVDALRMVRLMIVSLGSLSVASRLGREVPYWGPGPGAGGFGIVYGFGTLTIIEQGSPHGRNMVAAIHGGVRSGGDPHRMKQAMGYVRKTDAEVAHAPSLLDLADGLNL